jgi:hypothetical protein
MFSDRFDVLKNNLKKKTLFWCISMRKALWTATATTISNTPLILKDLYSIWFKYSTIIGEYPLVPKQKLKL